LEAGKHKLDSETIEMPIDLEPDIDLLGFRRLGEAKVFEWLGITGLLKGY
jgi:hypothetical protein